MKIEVGDTIIYLGTKWRVNEFYDKDTVELRDMLGQKLLVDIKKLYGHAHRVTS